MIRILVTLITCTALITGCSSSKQQAGGYYKDDGPGRNIPANIQAIPNAVPQIESHASANMRPYVVFGKRYVPVTSERPFRQKGIASWYGRKFHGNKTANGEIYDMYAMTAAHPTLPLPSYARVTHAHSGKSVVVRINDRGPFHGSRIIDLSYVAAAKLGLIGPGHGPVIVEAITHDDIRNKAYHGTDTPAPKAMPIPNAAPPSASPPTLTTQAPAPRPDAMAALNMETGTPPGTPDASDTASIFLQYGAFSTPENADKLASRMNQEIAHIEHRRAEIRSSTNLYRVHIGPYENRAQAVNAALRIQSETGREASFAIQDPAESASHSRTALSL